jgi:hypothetical protein
VDQTLISRYGVDDLIVLLGDDDSSASEAEVDDVSLRAESAAPGAGLFNSPETTVDSTTPAPPSSPDGWHDIDDFPETVPRLEPIMISCANSYWLGPFPLHPEGNKGR